MRTSRSSTFFHFFHLLCLVFGPSGLSLGLYFNADKTAVNFGSPSLAFMLVSRKGCFNPLKVISINTSAVHIYLHSASTFILYLVKSGEERNSIHLVYQCSVSSTPVRQNLFFKAKPTTQLSDQVHLGERHI